MAQSIQSVKAITTILNRMAKWLLLLAILWLCWSMARIIWLILAPPLAPNLAITELKTSPVAGVNNGSAFAIFDDNRPKPQVARRPVPNVELAGVMLAIPAQSSSAMLKVDGTIASYRIGEPIGNLGYQLSDVAWDKVTITDDSGQNIELTMPERMSLDQGLNFNNNKSARSNRSSNLPSPSQSANSKDDMIDDMDIEDFDADEDRAAIRRPSSNKDSNQSNNSPETQIDNAINELKQNPASYLSRMGVMATGEGYQVTDAMPSDIKNRLGLESGDKVISVNGRNVGSNPAGDADLLSQVKQSGEAQIQVKRGEQVITIRQNFK